ncbi:MAG: hypothetical protein E7599_00060 [Ruminococcaceae bacterium]|nr:hypothetical protein [Oscillospiraceae bacterium]
MKKTVVLLLCMMCLLTSCVRIRIILPGQSDTDKTLDDMIGENIGDVTDKTEDEGSFIGGSEVEDETGIDYDYSDLRPADQYNKVLEFVLFFDHYVGSTVKIHGLYTYEDDKHVLTVADNLNCCYAPFEIYVADGSYPANESWVIIEGTLSSVTVEGETINYINVNTVIPSEER